MLSTIFRVVLGIIFATIGYLIAAKYLPISAFQTPFLVQFLTAFVFGLTGVFLVPMVSGWVRKVSSSFAQRVAQEVIRQIRFREIRDRINPSVKFKPNETPNGHKLLNPMIVDTSAIIDGRLADIVGSGFLYGSLIVPRFVLTELQHIADHPDSLKRNRGRRGFQILEDLKKSKIIETKVIDQNPEGKTVDDKLLRLAKEMNAKIVTNDFNLNKVATLSGVKILNVNELSQAVKSIVLPGEQLSVKVIQAGKEKEQGVGYLPDGTMIVVEKGKNQVGKTVDVIVSRVIQTVAGRMIFTQIRAESQSEN